MLQRSSITPARQNRILNRRRSSRVSCSLLDFIFLDSLISPSSTIPKPVQVEESPLEVGGLDFTKYDVPAEEVIGRQTFSDDSNPKDKRRAAARNLNFSSTGVESSTRLLSNAEEVVEELPTDAQVNLFNFN